MPSVSRDLRLDFFRGLALMLIFVDHIPESVLRYFTLQGVQFFDAAEVFIFISGFTAALVYGRTMLKQGAFFAAAQVLRRAWQLYVAHIFLFMMFIAEVSYTITTFNNPMYSEESRVADFLGQPHIAIVKALLLEFQPTFLDILPLYIVLLLALPPVLLGLRRQPLIVLVPSFALYLFISLTDIGVPAYPPGHVWFFNPLAWQFLFIAGAALGYAGIRGRRWPGLGRALLPPAVLVLAATTLIRITWTAHGVWDAVPGLLLKELWPVDKSNLSPLRLVPFFASVVVVGQLVPPQPAFMQARWAQPFLLCGRQSLEVFCAGILLSALAHFMLAEYDSALPVQLAVNIAGILLMWITARTVEWYKKMGRTPVPLPAAGDGQ